MIWRRVCDRLGPRKGPHPLSRPISKSLNGLPAALGRGLRPISSKLQPPRPPLSDPLTKVSSMFDGFDVKLGPGSAADGPGAKNGVQRT